MKIDIEQFDERDDPRLQRYDYDDETVFVADLGLETGDATVDVVDRTAIVVTDSGSEFEFGVPDGVREASIRNGVLTFEVAR